MSERRFVGVAIRLNGNWFNGTGPDDNMWAYGPKSERATYSSKQKARAAIQYRIDEGWVRLNELTFVKIYRRRRA